MNFETFVILGADMKRKIHVLLNMSIDTPICMDDICSKVFYANYLDKDDELIIISILPIINNKTNDFPLTIRYLKMSTIFNIKTDDLVPYIVKFIHNIKKNPYNSMCVSIADKYIKNIEYYKSPSYGFISKYQLINIANFIKEHKSIDITHILVYLNNNNN